MEYSKKEIISSLRHMDEFKVIDDPLNDKDSDILVEWKGIPFFLSIDDKPDNKKSEYKKTRTPFGVYFFYPLDEKYSKISLLDKYRLAGYLTNENDGIAHTMYRESVDCIITLASHHQAFERLPEFKLMPAEFKFKGFRYILLSLITMCLETAKDVERELDAILANPEEFHKKIKVY
ncbi:hypothetical protein [Pantoea sp. Cy-640]|uniref:hypothetical protein n=1 Tax=Pantoea sp. Cy-640 TaxID=2608353 RepID=UPI001419E31D|nr:hypothetical protein [Pantoea sp. Cy-640]NIG15860.1 hypothetical protein [Pantoea sp. Cy-640]